MSKTVFAKGANLFGAVVVLGLCLASFSATALPPGGSTPSGARGSKRGAAAATSDQDKAQEHFRKARAHYSAGRYRAAITELEEAVILDPAGAELVYNLGLIHEKLGDIDDATRYYRQYVEMTDDEAEKERIRGVLRRLEGAREEVVVPPAESGSSAPVPVAPPAEKKRGRMDGWVIGTGALAGAALLAGGYFGYKAWSDRVDDPPTTGPGLEYGELQDRADRAHGEAVLADIGFGVALAAGVTSAVLYFAREAKPQPASKEPSPEPGDQVTRVVPTVAILPGGAAAGIGFGF